MYYSFMFYAIVWGILYMMSAGWLKRQMLWPFLSNGRDNNYRDARYGFSQFV
jgi:hypothetical protein